MSKEKSSLSLAYKAIILFGIVSLLGDIIYEGCRGLVPDYLKFLGATAFIVGVIGGLGEFIGYSVRLVSGFLADTIKSYWLFIFLGYGLLVSIPLLGFSSTWQVAAIFVLLERLGKALRTPSRDIILSVIGKEVGTGKTFGIHELLDQIGAIVGPAIVAVSMLTSSNDYRLTFLILLLPYISLMSFLTYVYKKIGKTYKIAKEGVEKQKAGLPRTFYIYTLAVVMNTVGLIPVALILYKASFFFAEWLVPIVYLMIQGIDASIALAAGHAYDRFGVKFLALPFLLAIIPSVLTVVGNDALIIVVAAVFFGLVLGMQESIYRAAVADVAPVASRGRAYGIFSTAYGVSFLISGAIYGFFLDVAGTALIAIIYALSAQFFALVLLNSIRSVTSA